MIDNYYHSLPTLTLPKIIIIIIDIISILIFFTYYNIKNKI